MAARPVLMLAYHFPPMGGAAVQRNLQLARHLPALGYEPTVLTAPGVANGFRWTPADGRLGLDGARTTVHRLAGDQPDPRAARRERWFRLRTPWERWWSQGVLREAAEHGRDVDLVHASVAPFRTADSALAVARLVDAPLVLDLEDPWALDEMLVYPTVAHRRLELGRMRSVLRAADAVVMNTREARRRVLEAFPELAADRVFAIPNAFDAEDFDSPPPTRTDSGFRIVHTGSLHTDMGLRHPVGSLSRRLLRGAVRGVDFITRSHVFLLRAVDAVLASRPDLTGRIEVHLAGVFTEQDRRIAARRSYVRLHEFLPHDETVRLLRSAGLLFLPMHDLAPGERAGIVPHKTYEYLAAERPILAAVPPGDARDLLEASGIATLCAPADVEAMRTALLAQLERRRAGIPPPAPDRSVMARCSATRLAHSVAEVYDTLLATDPAAARRARPSEPARAHA